MKKGVKIMLAWFLSLLTLAGCAAPAAPETEATEPQTTETEPAT